MGCSASKQKDPDLDRHATTHFTECDVTTAARPLAIAREALMANSGPAFCGVLAERMISSILAGGPMEIASTFFSLLNSFCTKYLGHETANIPSPVTATRLRALTMTGFSLTRCVGYGNPG